MRQRNGKVDEQRNADHRGHEILDHQQILDP